MRIDPDACDGCGRCVAECPRSAIGPGPHGRPAIDPGRCDGCRGVLDVECARACRAGAIVGRDGSVPAFDPTWRLRAEHVIWLMAVMGSRGNGRFPAGTHSWDAFRRLLAAAFTDPGLRVRLTRNFDDNCTGCPVKRKPGHAEECGRLDDACFARLGVEPGTVMGVWEAVDLAGRKFDEPFLRSLGVLADEVLDCYRAALPPPP